MKTNRSFPRRPDTRLRSKPRDRLLFHPLPSSFFITPIRLFLFAPRVSPARSFLPPFPRVRVIYAPDRPNAYRLRDYFLPGTMLVYHGFSAAGTRPRGTRKPSRWSVTFRTRVRPSPRLEYSRALLVPRPNCARLGAERRRKSARTARAPPVSVVYSSVLRERNISLSRHSRVARRAAALYTRGPAFLNRYTRN